jgi:Domain of unknown function (DUF5666)
MNAVTYDRRNEDWEQSEDEQDAGRMPRRPRRQLFNKRSAALAAVVACAAGFYAGVRVEKGQLNSSSSTGGIASALASLRSGAAGARGAGAASAAGGAAAGGAAAGGAAGATRSGTGAGGSGAAGAGSFGGGAGAAAFAGGGFGGGSASFGTVSSVKGSSIFVTDSTGNLVKVKLSSATKITKSLGVRRSSLHPGDTVVIRGLKNSNGTLTATTVSDSGNSSTGTGSSGSSGSSGRSALSSLFSSGGAGGG